MKISDIMTTDLVTVGPDTSFKMVVEVLIRSDVSALPVVDAAGALIGLITEADLVSKDAFDGHRRRALALLADIVSVREHHWMTKAAGSVAADIMTRDVVVCGPDDEVRTVARRMLERGVKRMPVLDGGVLVGIVSRHDILAMWDRPDEAIASDVGRAIQEVAAVSDDLRVAYAVNDGVVTLTGDAGDRWDALLVSAMVRDIPGTVDVIDGMRVHRADKRRPARTPA